MRNYLIINGKNSREIHGLIIQEFAPISKPKKRIETTEIDGRDGDVVDELGYSAYDKEVSIGLHGDFNIDEVIEYFNTSGEVIFSNEQGKVYRFGIYEQIDFERLVRYRTAEVTFHVQPFKHSSDEPLLEWTNSGTDTMAEIKVDNIGNVIARPYITMEASGHLVIDVDNVTKLKADLPEQMKVIIDCEEMNAVNEEGRYLNRYFIGDYKSLYVPMGEHSIKVGGDVTSLSIKHYIRWI